MNRQRVYSGAPWEQQAAYCRALRVGNHVYVTGTVAVDSDGVVVGANDGYVQASRCLEIIEESLHQAGAQLADVVRTRMFVTDIDRWEEFARAHRERFEHHPPATTMVEVSRLIRPEFLIEIEADAILPHTVGEAKP